MSILVSYAFQAVIRCEHCCELVSFGWVSSARCQVCEKLSVQKDFWKRFGITQALQATEVTNTLHQQRDEQSALSYRELSPYCRKCKRVVELRDFTAAAQVGWLTCPQCEAQISVREVIEASEASPRARWVLHETFHESGPAKTVLFACLSCGGGISVDGSARIVECSSCQQKNFIPGALWRHFQPTMQDQPFFVVYQFRHEPLFELRSKHPKAEIRRVAAETQAPPEALSEVFEAETDLFVLDSLTRNPNCPPETLRTLSKTVFPRVRENTAKHPNTPLLALELLALDGDESVSHAAKQHPLFRREQQRRPATPRTPPQDSEERDIPNTKLIFQEMPFDADPFRSAPVAMIQREGDVPLVLPTLLPLGQRPHEVEDPLAQTEGAKGNSWRQRLTRWMRRERP